MSQDKIFLSQIRHFAKVMKTAEHSAKHKVFPGGPCLRVDSAGYASLKLALVSLSLFCIFCSIIGCSFVLTQENGTFFTGRLMFNPQPPYESSFYFTAYIKSPSPYCLSCRSVSRVLPCALQPLGCVLPITTLPCGLPYLLLVLSWKGSTLLQPEQAFFKKKKISWALS